MCDTQDKDGAGEFPLIGVEEENVEPDIEVLQRVNWVLIGYSVPPPVPGKEYKQDEEHRVSNQRFFCLDCVLAFNPARDVYDL